MGCVDWDASGEMKLDVEQWEADWDDDNIDDEFSKQLRYQMYEEEEIHLRLGLSFRKPLQSKPIKGGASI